MGDEEVVVGVVVVYVVEDGVGYVGIEGVGYVDYFMCEVEGGLWGGFLVLVF